jgi:hypothetical protein
MVAEGHTLCNHSWSHDEMLRTRTPDQIRSDMQRTNDAIRAVAPGAVIGYFRAPGGNWSPDIVSIAASLGMTSISWTVDPRDWKGPGVQSIINTVLTHTRPGGIVLLHDGAGPQTVTALRTILPDLAGRFTLIALPAPTGVDQTAAPACLSATASAWLCPPRTQVSSRTSTWVPSAGLLRSTQRGHGGLGGDGQHSRRAAPGHVCSCIRLCRAASGRPTRMRAVTVDRTAVGSRSSGAARSGG